MRKQTLQKYKGVIIPFVFLIATIFIVFQVILPSVESSGNLNRELSAEGKKLSEYKNSITVLSSLNDKELNKNFDIVTSALPATKDLQGMFLALNNAAGESNAILSGFSVQAGEVFEKNAKESTSSNPAVSMSVELSGIDENNLLDFMGKLSSNFPLSKITLIDLINGQAEIDIDFYYKPYDLNRINSNVVLPLTPKEEKLLNELSSK